MSRLLVLFYEELRCQSSGNSSPQFPLGVGSSSKAVRKTFGADKNVMKRRAPSVMSALATLLIAAPAPSAARGKGVSSSP